MKIARIKTSSLLRRWLFGSTALGILSSSAATVTWTGSGTDGNYNTAGNWNPSAPADGDMVVFPDGASTYNVVLNGNYSPAKLAFSSTGVSDYTLDGTGSLAGAGVVLEKTGDSYLTLGGTTISPGKSNWVPANSPSATRISRPTPPMPSGPAETRSKSRPVPPLISTAKAERCTPPRPRAVTTPWNSRAAA